MVRGRWRLERQVSFKKFFLVLCSRKLVMFFKLTFQRRLRLYLYHHHSSFRATAAQCCRQNVPPFLSVCSLLLPTVHSRDLLCWHAHGCLCLVLGLSPLVISVCVLSSIPSKCQSCLNLLFFITLIISLYLYTIIHLWAVSCPVFFFSLLANVSFNDYGNDRLLLT